MVLLNIRALILAGLYFCLNSCILFKNVIGQNFTDTKNDSNIVEEVQHAICRIATDEIQASANASVTRQLNGVCSTKDMNDRFDQLELNILREMKAIKQALEMEGYIVPEVHPKTLENSTPDGSPLLDDYPDYSNIEPKPVPKTSTTNNAEELAESNDIDLIAEQPEIVLKKHAPESSNVSYSRDLEAIKNNATIQMTELGPTFLYFWKIYDVQKVLDFWDTFVESPSIFLMGLSLKINLHPHHLGTQYIAVELSSNNDHYTVKHRFSVLNQIDAKNDLTSQILGLDANMFRVSSQKITTGGFVNDDSLMIKVLIALKA